MDDREREDSKRVTGLGGVFFKSADPARIIDWYRAHLGIAAEKWGGFAFQWGEKGRPDETGYTVWSSFPDSTDYFSPSDHPYMINFRVADLEALLTALKAEGVEVVGEMQEHPNGKFAWVLDPEGRKIELWEPVPSAKDPYLE
jgi:predicted enzyme related to lactoylglutathione lyase